MNALVEQRCLIQDFKNTIIKSNKEKDLELRGELLRENAYNNMVYAHK